MFLILQAGNDVAEKDAEPRRPCAKQKVVLPIWLVKLLLPAIGVCFLLFLSQEPLETFEGTEFRKTCGTRTP